jgi:hypothetical protein
VQVADSGAVYRKYKASVEISSGGRVYTEDSGSVLYCRGNPEPRALNQRSVVYRKTWCSTTKKSGIPGIVYEKIKINSIFPSKEYSNSNITCETLPTDGIRISAQVLAKPFLIIILLLGRRGGITKFSLC